MNQQIVLLNGPSSSGKSTLSIALQNALVDAGQNYGVITIDSFLAMANDQVLYEKDVYDISMALCNPPTNHLAYFPKAANRQSQSEGNKWVNPLRSSAKAAPYAVFSISRAARVLYTKSRS